MESLSQVKSLSNEECNSFINALQLGIESKIVSFKRAKLEGVDILLISFDRKRRDKGLNLAEQLLKGHWVENALSDKREIFYQVEEQKITPLLTQFLLLTRLKKENMLSLAKLNMDYKPFVQILYGTGNLIAGEDIFDVSVAANVVFEEVKKNKITLRELSEQTRLTSVALSNFKSGKDIRLSNFLRICSAVGLHVTVKPKIK